MQSLWNGELLLDLFACWALHCRQRGACGEQLLSKMEALANMKKGPRGVALKVGRDVDQCDGMFIVSPLRRSSASGNALDQQISPGSHTIPFVLSPPVLSFASASDVPPGIISQCCKGATFASEPGNKDCWQKGRGCLIVVTRVASFLFRPDGCGWHERLPALVRGRRGRQQRPCLGLTGKPSRSAGGPQGGDRGGRDRFSMQ